MRKANYDKFPSTKLTGMLVQGWDSIISMLKKKMDARKVLAVDLYTGVYEEEVLDAFSKEFSGRVMNVRDLMKPEQEIQTLTERFMTEDVLFGYVTNLKLEDYFEKYCPNISAILDLPGVREKMTAPDGHIYTIPYVCADSTVG